MIEKYLEHTHIKPETTFRDVTKLCLDAALYGFRSVVVRPEWVKTAKNILDFSKIKIVTTLGFPYGLCYTPVYQKGSALDLADEIDLLPNIHEIKNKDYYNFTIQVDKLRKMYSNKIIKLIVETGVFDEQEINWLCIFAEDLHIDYIKSNTGLYKRKRSILEDLALLKKHTRLPIKMAGGIKDYQTAKVLLDNGAALLGVSAGVDICKGERMAGTGRDQLLKIRWGG